MPKDKEQENGSTNVPSNQVNLVPNAKNIVERLLNHFDTSKNLLYYFNTLFYNSPFITSFIFQFYTLK